MQPATSAAPSSLERFARGRPKLRSPRSPSRTLPVGAARAAGACWRRWWPQRKGGAVWRVKAANRCIGYLRYLMRALPSPVVRNGGGDPAALVGPCCCCKAQIHLLLCDASCHLPKCGVWVQPIGLRSLRGVHARARPSPRRQRSAENLPFSHSLKWQCACLHIQRCRLMQTINVPEKITRVFCGADLYSCVRWSTDKICTSFESTAAATKAVHCRSCSKSAVSILSKISRGFADRLERAIFERFARGPHARAQSLPAPKQAL